MVDRVPYESLAYQGYKEKPGERLQRLSRSIRIGIGISIFIGLCALALGIVGVVRAYDTHRKFYTLEQLTVTQNATIERLTIIMDLLISGNVIISDSLVVSGDSTIEGDLILTGNSTMSGNLIIDENLITGGNTTIEESLTVEGNTFLETLDVDNSFISVGNFFLFGNGTNRFEQRTNSIAFGIGAGVTTPLTFLTPLGGGLGVYSVPMTIIVIPQDGLYSFEFHCIGLYTVAAVAGSTFVTLTLGTNTYVARKYYGTGSGALIDSFDISFVTYLYAGQFSSVFTLTNAVATTYTIAIGGAVFTMARLA